MNERSEVSRLDRLVMWQCYSCDAMNKDEADTEKYYPEIIDGQLYEVPFFTCKKCGLSNKAPWSDI